MLCYAASTMTKVRQRFCNLLETRINIKRRSKRTNCNELKSGECWGERPKIDHPMCLCPRPASSGCTEPSWIIMKQPWRRQRSAARPIPSLLKSLRYEDRNDHIHPFTHAPIHNPNRTGPWPQGGLNPNHRSLEGSRVLIPHIDQ